MAPRRWLPRPSGRLAPCTTRQADDYLDFQNTPEISGSSLKTQLHPRLSTACLSRAAARRRSAKSSAPRRLAGQAKEHGGREITGAAARHCRAAAANNPLAYFAWEYRGGMRSLATLQEFLLPERGQQGGTEKLLHLPCQQGPPASLRHPGRGRRAPPLDGWGLAAT